MQKHNAIKVVSANLGNQMFRYMLAKILEMRSGTFTITDAAMLDWGIFHLPADESLYQIVSTGHVHSIDVENLVNVLKTNENTLIKLDCYAQRVEYYSEYRDFFRNIFSSQECGHPIANNEILINVRAGDILGGGHPDYIPVPVSYYKEIVLTTGLRPVFLGQLKDNWYLEKIKEVFPSARYVSTGSAIADFQSIRNARNVVISVSSFSWLAAWLSEVADRIFMPQLGLMNPAQRPDVNLVPRDPRWVFTRFPILRYDARESHKQLLLASDFPITWNFGD